MIPDAGVFWLGRIVMENPLAAWFETRAAKSTQAAYTCLHAALLTMRV
jgi:hypothetical protein